MMTTKRSLILLIVLFSSLLLAGCGTSIQGGHMGLQTEPLDGGVQEEVLGDGFNWTLPWNGTIVYDVRWSTKREKIHAVSKDGLHIKADISMRIRPNIKELYRLHMEIGQNYYQDVVQPVFLAVAQSAFSNYNHDKMTEKIPEIQKKISTRVHEALKGKHLQINSIIVEDISFPSEVEAAIEAKLAKKQEMMQKEFELKIAESEKEIRKTEAEALAESQRIINDRLTNKYLQYLLIQVQKELAKSPNKVFIFMPVGAGGIPLLLNIDEENKSLKAKKD